ANGCGRKGLRRMRPRGSGAGNRAPEYRRGSAAGPRGQGRFAHGRRIGENIGPRAACRPPGSGPRRDPPQHGPHMNFHEYQAKQLFADYGIAVPAGRVARSPEEAVDAAKAIPGDLWVVKAQIHAGGRGKAGGVKLARTLDEVREYAKGMLGTKMETYQSAGVALPIDSV